MNLRYNNFKNLHLTERIASVYEIEVKNKNEAIELGKILYKNGILYKISSLFSVLVICEVYSQITKLKEILKKFNKNINEEKLILIYEIETKSKNHCRKLAKKLHQKGILYKIYNPSYPYIWAFCGTSFQIEKLKNILDEFDLLSYIINAE